MENMCIAHLALGKYNYSERRDSLKRKEKEAVCYYVYTCRCTCISCTRMHTIVYIINEKIL